MMILLQAVATRPVAAVPLSFGDAVKASLAGAFTMVFAAIPRILAFIVILLIGWFVASLLARAVQAILRAIRFNDLAQRIGIGGFVQKMRADSDASTVVASVVKWLVRVVVLLVAFDALGLPAVSDVLRQLLLWLPNLVVALVILIVASIAARALADVVRGASAEAGFKNPETLANVAKTGVMALAILVAVNQVGVAQNIINILLTGLVAALALASGLAFGLGGRELAGSVLENWYGKTKGAPRG